MTTPSEWWISSPTARSTLLERATNVWMKIARGDVADRFDKVKAIYLDVTKDTKGQSIASTRFSKRTETIAGP